MTMYEDDRSRDVHDHHHRNHHDRIAGLSRQSTSGACCARNKN